MKKSPMPARRSQLRRSEPLTRAPFKPARPKTTRPEKTAHNIVTARSNGVCEVCGQAPAQQHHHRRKAGRVSTPENLLAVCGLGNYSGCHGRIEQNPDRARLMGWWVDSHQSPAEVPVVHARFGRVLLTSDGSFTHINEEAA